MVVRWSYNKEFYRAFLAGLNCRYIRVIFINHRELLRQIFFYTNINIRDTNIRALIMTELYFFSKRVLSEWCFSLSVIFFINLARYHCRRSKVYWHGRKFIIKLNNEFSIGLKFSINYQKFVLIKVYHFSSNKNFADWFFCIFCQLM